jgi:tetratricopeptide (TPR) repeat protein
MNCRKHTIYVIMIIAAHIRRKEGGKLDIMQEETQKKGLSLFCMYAQEDRELYIELNRHLSTLKRQKVITNWYDFAITSMEDWKLEIKAQFNNADIILLLVSPDFVSSDYCYSTDMSQVVKRHEKGETHVIPIILRSSFWNNTPFGRLQALPIDGKPITIWQDRDEAFLTIVQGIFNAINLLLSHSLPSDSQLSQSVREPLSPRTIAISSPIKVLYIYTHKDSILCIELDKHLSSLKRQGIIDEWYSLDITSGMDQTDSTNQFIHQAQLILPMISADFLASDYIYSTEMKYIIEQHYAGITSVIPIILRPCIWQDSPLVNFGVLPVGGRAVITWNDRDEAFLNIAVGIRQAMAVPLPSPVSSEERKQQNVNIMKYRSEQSTSKPIKFFYIYAREDTDLLNHLQKHLLPLVRQGLVVVSYDRLIQAGTNWHTYIDEELNSAQFILLIVTADFLASEYCYSIEMERALKRQEAGECLVIPIIMRPVDWLDTPIGKLQALPTSAKPVTTWADIDEAFSDITQNIRQIVLSLLNQVEQKTKEQWIIEGKEYYDIHQYDDALTAYEKALDLDPDNEPVRETVGHIQIQLGLYDKALMTYEELLRASSSASGYLFKGLALQRMGKPIEALAAYQKAREHGYSG